MRVIQRFLEHPFLNSVLKLASGTSIAHLITIAASPLLTRLFPSEAFGELQLFQSSLVIGGIITTGTYEFAIVRPSDKSIALTLVKLCLTLALLFNLVLFVPLALNKDWIADSLNISSFSVVVFPLILFFQAVFSTGEYWFLRNDKYSLLSFAKFSQSAGAALWQIIHGLLRFSLNGLLLGLIFGRILVSLIFVFNFGKEQIREMFIIPLKKVKQVAASYSEHPGHITFSTLLSTGGIEIPVLIIGSLFGQTELGFYALAYRVLSAPSAFIGISVGQVFYRTTADRFIKRLPLVRTVINTWGWLLLIVIGPMIILFLFAEPIFTFVYGTDWLTSGTVAKILVPLLMVDFISAPTGKLLIILNKQKAMSLFSLFISASRIGGILFGVVQDDFLTGIQLLVILHTTVLILYNLYLLYSVKVYDRILSAGNS